MRRFSNPVDLAIGLFVVGLAIVLFRDSPYVYAVERPTLDLSLRYLPFYALASLARMVVAMVLSLLIALLLGYLAAVRRRWARIILPTADILQSIPVLGFFPAAVFLFIRLFGNSVVGVEIAAIFLIITSALWNLVFAVYESITTIPEDLQLAGRQFGIRGYTQWLRVVLPAVLHKLAYNAMISWANGWYFLIACEIIIIGPIRYRLPGLGSYLAQTMSTGDYQLAIYGLGVLAGVILFFHVVVWSPLNEALLHGSERRWNSPFPQAVASGDTFEHRPSECGHCVQDFLADLDLRDLPGEAAGLESAADDTLPPTDLRFYPAALVVPCGHLPGHAAVAADLGNMAIPNGWIPRRLRADHGVLWRRYNHIQGLPIPFPQQIPCGRSIIGAVRQKARDRGVDLIQEPR